MNRITATTVGYPFLFALIAISSLGISDKIAMGILFLLITVVTLLVSQLKDLKINGIISGLLAATIACAMYAAVEYKERSGYIEGVEYPTHLVGTVANEICYSGRYQYIIKTDDGKRVLFYSDELSNGKLYDRFEGDVTMRLRDSVTDGAPFSAYADNEENCTFTDGKFGILSVFSYAREWSGERIDEISDGESAEFLKGVMLGEDSHINASLRRAFKATGLSHILVVSGSHLTTVLLAVTAVFSMSRKGRRSYYIAALMLILAYMALVGFGPSVVRSGICCAVVGFGFVIGRDTNPVNSLGAAALITGIIDPYTAVSLGFQLSFFSTFGIVTVGLIIIGKIKQSHIPNLMKTISGIFVITVIAQAFILPVLIPVYSEFSLMSVIANLLISVAVEIAIISTLIYLVLCATWLFYPLAIPFGFISKLFSKYCVHVANSLANNRLAYVKIPQYACAMLVTVAFLVLAFALIRGKRCIKPVAVTVSLCLIFAVAATVCYNDSIRITAVTDGVYIITYNGNSVVAGCGECLYDAKRLLYSQSQMINSNVRLIVGKDNRSNALVTAIDGTNPDIVMAPMTYRLKEQYACRMTVLEPGSITPFENCRVTDTADYTLVSIDGVNIAVAKKCGIVTSELGVDVLLCTDGVKGIADTAVIMLDTKPLALSANRVYNTSSDSFDLVVAKSGRIISAE